MEQLQVHTLDITHNITKWEAERIKEMYKLKFNETLDIRKTEIKGINRISIRENTISTNGERTNKKSYILCLEVNLSKLLNINSIYMTTIDKRNCEKMIKALNSILTSKLNLISRNSNSEHWTLSRLDCGVDILLDKANEDIVGLYISLLHNSINIFNNRKCNYTTTHIDRKPETKYESITFGNDSYNYNIYAKAKQLANEYDDIPPEQYLQAKNLLRVEKQIKGKGIANIIGSPQKLSLILEQSVRDRIKESIIKDIEVFFGKGTHYSKDIAFSKIMNSTYKEDYKTELINELTLYSIKGRYTSFIDDGRIIKNQLKMQKHLEALGISIAMIDDCIAHDNSIESLSGLYELVSNSISSKPQKNKKGIFGQIFEDELNCRYKCNFSYHDEDGNRKRLCMADKNREKLENKIFKKLLDVYVSNMEIANDNLEKRKVIISQTINDLCKFRTIINREDLLEVIDVAIKELKGDN